VRDKVLLSLTTILASLLAVATVQAQEGTGYTATDDEVNRIAKQLYCPVCPNTPLDVCETKACQDWRAQIRDQLTSGWTEDQIISYFVDQYGERVLAEPRRSGFTSLVWILPIIAVALGVTVAVQVVRGWRRESKAEVADEPAAELPAETVARLERELRELR
jgi:cytochrome c-type biogenesis protein CcmH